MEDTNEKILIEAGLSEEQAAIYSALLDKGPMKAGSLSSWTGIKRGLIYKVLDQLENMGLISQKGGDGTVAVFAPEHPSRLAEMMERKERSLALSKETVMFSLGTLSSKFNLLSGKPNVQFYEGEEGIKKISDDSLSSKTEILSYIDNEAVNKYMATINKEHIENRKQLKIKKKMLAVDSEYIRERVKTMDKETTEVRIIPKSESFGTAMQIYDNKVSYITLTENKKIGIIIEDTNITQMHKIIFQALWEKSETLTLGTRD